MEQATHPEAVAEVTTVDGVEVRWSREFPGYGVDSYGNVYSLKRGKVKRLRPSWSDTGGVGIRPRKDGKTHSISMPRLLLELFVGPCPPGHRARHKDDDSQNNRLDNLEWSRRMNPTPARGSRHGRAKLTESDIPLIFSLDEQGVPKVEIARRFGVSDALICRLLKGEKWAHVPRSGTVRS